MRPLCLLLLVAVLGCHSASKKKLPYDSTNVVPGGKDSLSAGAPQDVDSLEAQIQAPDTLFEDGSRPIPWANAGFHDPAGFKRFLLVFRGWVQRDRVDSISEHVRFPLRAAGSPAWFRERYPHLFTPALKSVILRQRLDRIFRNGQGAMLGNGEIWFVEAHGRYWVSAIN